LPRGGKGLSMTIDVNKKIVLFEREVKTTYLTKGLSTHVCMKIKLEHASIIDKK
jgi:hypothetical protein